MEPRRDSLCWQGVPRRNGETVSIAMVWMGSLGSKSFFLHVGSDSEGVTCQTERRGAAVHGFARGVHPPKLRPCSSDAAGIDVSRSAAESKIPVASGRVRGSGGEEEIDFHRSTTDLPVGPEPAVSGYGGRREDCVSEDENEKDGCLHIGEYGSEPQSGVYTSSCRPQNTQCRNRRGVGGALYTHFRH